MKTRNFLLTAMALMIAITVSATKFPTLNVIPVEKQKALVAFESPKPATVEISLTNKAGDVMYYKKSEAPVDNFRMVFNFQDLEDGNYDVSLNYNNCKINRQVTVSNHLLKSVGRQERSFGPFYTLEDNLLKISYLNNGKKNVLINIYHDGQHIAGRRLGKDMCIQKAFDFSKLESGKYEVVLSSSTDDYPFTVSK